MVRLSNWPRALRSGRTINRTHRRERDVCATRGGNRRGGARHALEGRSTAHIAGSAMCAPPADTAFQNKGNEV